uniref:ATP synthase complex subunit 8 n=1 Tax=Acanthoscelides obtectus TaxID=200917 RepID=A0A343KQ06_ACAOB|nr:ATP synthase F0 subunit 8 [Acanthoscelides obtectus]ARR75258.1 ATP synthase F0 subunit 8 [Acanthoscelides obtectus]ATL15478.1 ATP synthase F0 subunit 8 [Acanthoscelides obtectus]
MPQMAPLNWLTLMIFFIYIFLAINMMIFFSFNYSVKKNQLMKKYAKFFWKW